MWLWKRATALLSAVAVFVTAFAGAIPVNATETKSDTVSIYQVRVEENEHGIVSLDKDTGLYAEDETVHVHITPNEGYDLELVEVKTEEEERIETFGEEKGISFTMPGLEVVVKATFVEVSGRVEEEEVETAVERQEETKESEQPEKILGKAESETVAEESEIKALTEEERYQYDDSGEAKFVKTFKVHGSGKVILRTLDGKLIDCLEDGSVKSFNYYDGSGAPMDVMVEVVADEGINLSAYTTTWYMDGLSVLSNSASEYDMNVSTFKRGHYMTQFKYNEDFNIYFSDAGIPAVRNSRLAIGTYSGAATFYSYNNGDGSADTSLFGGGYLICDNDGSELAGETLYISYCTSGHSKWNPRSGMRGTYTVTVTRIADGYVYGRIDWINANGSYQNLGGTFSRKQKDFYIEVEKVVGGNMNHIYDSKEYKEPDLSATFKVYKDKGCTDLIGTIKTDSDGSSKEKLKVDEPGTYYIQETKSSAMFSVNAKVYSIDVEEEGTSEIKQIPNRYYKAKVKGVKKDAKTGTTVPFSSLSLAGAIYTVYADKNCTVKLMTGETDKNGNINFEEPYFTCGTYYIKETRPPKGYKIDTTVHKVEIDPDVLGVDKEASNSDYNNVLKTFEFVSYDAPKLGKAKIIKVSTNPSISEGNRCYSLENATFKIVNTETGEEWAEKFVTNDKGESQVITLPAGNYYVEETSSPPGFELLKGIHFPLVVEDDETKVVEFEIENEPKNDPVAIILQKIDEETGEAYSMGDGEFKGAEYTLKYYDGYYKTAAELEGVKPARTWIIETDEKGEIHFRTAKKVSGDEFHYDIITGFRTIPLGTLSIRESKAPEGYLLDETLHIQNFTVESGTGKLITSYQVATSPEPVIRGGSSIQKFDRELDTANEQGDATRKDAVFELINRSEKAIKYLTDGKMYEPGDVIATFKTDTEGIARTAERALPYGTYEWREKEAPEGYLNTGIISRTFRIRKEGQYEELKTSDTAIKNNIKRGSASIEKWDNETDKFQAQGGATLDGAVFELYNRSKNAVLIQEEDKSLRNVEVDGLIGTFVTADGAVSTVEDYLPYGTYEWVEVKPPLGYLHTGVLSREFVIREDGEHVHLGTSDTAIKNDPIRYDFKLVKVGEGTNKRLSYVPFELVSDTTGETHRFMTDANGMFDSSSSWNLHGQNTNRGEIPEDGLWFGELGTLDESKGALLYDTYTLRELPCESNKGYELLEFKIYPTLRHGTTIDLGTLDDPLSEPIEIKTLAKDAETDLQFGYVGETTTIVDTVSYKNVTVGRTYKITGTLMSKETGQPFMVNGKVVTASTEFTAEAQEGTADVIFTFDSSVLKGKSVVVFENMYDDGELVAVHEDIRDEGQTVEYKEPEIGTKASDMESGGSSAHVSETTVIRDIVSYSDLIPGKEYAVKGVLMDKATGEPLVLSNGETVTSETTFTAKKSEGTVEMIFELDSRELAGTTVVAFESLEYNSREVAVHADINDAGQTVTFEEPEIGTKAADVETGLNEGFVSEKTTIIDTVSYKNLIVGEKYTIKGQLIEKSTGKVLMSDGRQVTAETTFVAKTKDGTVELEFSFNSSALAGEKVVAFEFLYYNEKEIASHSEINDKNQTVEFKEPKVKTSASEKGTGNKEITADGEVTIVDVVEYQNLIVGKKYTIKGILMDKKTAKPLLINGKEIMAEKTFKVKKTNGSVELAFTFDASGLKDKEVVVFETMYFNEREIASHTDLNDKSQTVKFVDKQEPSSNPTGTNPTGAPKAPKTGDDTPIGFYIAMIGGAALFILLVMRKRRKLM